MHTIRRYELKDKQTAHLQNKKNDHLNRCNICILPDNLPNVKINKHGVCNHCVTYIKRYKDWQDTRDIRNKNLEKIIDKVKSTKNSYDCLIPLSGGKDSIYTLYYFAKVLKLNCLCVTVDNSYMSDIAKININNALLSSGSDHAELKIDRDKINKIFSFFIKKCGQFCPVCCRFIVPFIWKVQRLYKIPLVVFGSGPRVDYLSDHPDLFESGELDFVSNVLKDNIEKKGTNLLKNDSVYDYYYKVKRELKCIINRGNIKVMPNQISSFDYLTPDYSNISELLNTEMGWQQKIGTLHHFDCKLHDIPEYMIRLKYKEIGKKTLENSQLIRMGLMSREEALENEKDSYNKIPTVLDDFLLDIDMTLEEFENYVFSAPPLDTFRSTKRKYYKLIRETFFGHSF